MPVSASGWKAVTGGLGGARTGIAWSGSAALAHVDPYLVWFDLTDFAGAALPDRDGARLLVQTGRGATARVESRVVPFEAMATLCERARRDPGGLRFELSVPLATPDARAPRRAAVIERFGTARPLAGTAMVVGFIDVGCAFANVKFRRWQGGRPGWSTRVAALWDQGEIDAGHALPWAVPADFGYGAEVSRAELDALIAAHRCGDRFDERACCAASGHRPLARLATHGTHIMDVATGHPSPIPWRTRGEPPASRGPHAADIIFVSLPRSVRGASIGGLLRAQVLDGLRYIVARAGPGAQIRVNLSYGAYGGPHDGSSIVEQAIDQEIERAQGRLQVVVAAGNAAGLALHARAALKPGATAEFHWHLRPDDPTDSFVELWSSSTDARLLVRAVPPWAAEPGPEDGWLAPGRLVAWRPETPAGPIGAALIHPERGEGERHMSLLATAATRGDGLRPAVPYGRWRIQVRNEGAEPFEVDAWCERDDPAFGSGLWPRQAGFSPTPSSRVLDVGTLSSLAHGRRTIVAGACIRGGRATRRSSRGDDRPGARQPDVLAPGDENVAWPGLPGAAVSSERSVRLDGTSVAAAVVTRRLLDGVWHGPAPAGTSAPID